MNPDVNELLRDPTDVGNVVENHSIVGGLGSAVGEALSTAVTNAASAPVGERDTFAGGGSTPYLFDRCDLSADVVVAGLEELRKGRNA